VIARWHVGGGRGRGRLVSALGARKCAQGRGQGLALRLHSRAAEVKRMAWRARGQGGGTGRVFRGLRGLVALVTCTCAVGCAEVEPADEERDYGAALAALRGRSTEPLPVGGALQVSLPADGRRHYGFELTGSARVVLRATPEQPSARLKLSLEQFQGGALHRLASAHAPVGRSVELTRELGRGRYRVSVALAGGAPSGVTVATSCSGAGCPAEEARCLFGDTFAERDALSRLELVDELRLHAESELGSDPAAPKQVIAALHTSSHTDVATVADAFAAADAGELRRVRFVERAGGARYVAWEYGAGDNSYGAFFAEGASRVLAAIHDGDVVDCARFAP
jgi:hypothetical protein